MATIQNVINARTANTWYSACGFHGYARFVARKKNQCILIGNRFVIPYDIIPTNVEEVIYFVWHVILKSDY